ncbi:MAG: Do family serine endopeptidase [Lewinellaceae bacterium]|nr:Do family serine endopeptidase [Lewinellaceae bacterium]
MQKYLLNLALAVAGGAVALMGAHFLAPSAQNVALISQSDAPVHFTHYNPNGSGSAVADFTFAADKTLPAVVNIQSSIRRNNVQQSQSFDFNQLPDPFRQFFGGEVPQGRSRRQNPADDMEKATGSGVIISTDGYIVTNNHVVRDAAELTVTLNDKHAYPATVIGTDPSSDLALIKIDAADLPHIDFGNSDEVKVGEWVVAVGNPFNLASTVTAGIISAKGRDLHIVEDKAPVESFLQTDAVVNPGNSGGALVNLNGQLVGINTAIASPTGVFAGYAFAIPSNLVAKVVEDLKTFGVVQRGYLGITIRSIDAAFAKEKDLGTMTGVYVDSLAEGSAAGAAGVKKGDVITAVDGQVISDSPSLLESIGKHRPGDRIQVAVQRKGKAQTFDVTLKNHTGNTDVVRKTEQSEILKALGAEFQSLPKAKAEKMGIEGGVEVTHLSVGKLSNQTDIREGFIITSINRQPVRDTKTLTKLLEDTQGGVLLEGIYPDNPTVYYYAFGL